MAFSVPISRGHINWWSALATKTHNMQRIIRPDNMQRIMRPQTLRELILPTNGAGANQQVWYTRSEKHRSPSGAVHENSLWWQVLGFRLCFPASRDAAGRQKPGRLKASAKSLQGSTGLNNPWESVRSAVWFWLAGVKGRAWQNGALQVGKKSPFITA